MTPTSVENVSPAPLGHYSPVVVLQGAAQLAFVSGQLPVDPTTGSINGGDLADQTRQALVNALRVLASVGGRATDIAKVTIFTTDLQDYAALNEVYAEMLGDSWPARSIVEVARLPRDAMVEIELVAAMTGPPLSGDGVEPGRT